MTIDRAGQELTGEVGLLLEAADVVRTGVDGSVGITMRDSSLLSAGPNSILSLDRFEFDPTTSQGRFDAQLRRGTLAVVSGRIAKKMPQAMTVRTPSACSACAAPSSSCRWTNSRALGGHRRPGGARERLRRTEGVGGAAAEPDRPVDRRDGDPRRQAGRARPAVCRRSAEPLVDGGLSLQRAGRAEPISARRSRPSRCCRRSSRSTSSTARTSSPTSRS